MLLGKIRIDSMMALAPMAGVTDAAFRTVCREQGAALAYTEMISSRALCYQDKKTVSLLYREESAGPLAVQIFGSEPQVMAKAAVKALEISKAEILDINMGCPTPKIANNGDGSALMKDPLLAGRIISAVTSSVNVPVTVKIRKGWDSGSVNAVEFAKMAEECGAAAVCIHGRTKTQGYSGEADWDIIAAVKRAVNIPVIANGDICSPQAAVRAKRITGADMLMIGRGSFGDPWIFDRCKAALEGREIPQLPPISERCDLAVRQFELVLREKGEKIAALTARKHYAWYLKGIPYGGYYKEQVTKIETMEDIYRITKDIKRDLR